MSDLTIAIAVLEAMRTFFMWAGVFFVVCFFGFVGLVWWDTRGEPRG